MGRGLTIAGVAILTLATVEISAAPAVVMSASDDPSYAFAEEHPAHIPSTSMEAALDELRRRFPNRVVIGFEELFEPRPASEPLIDLGPGNATLEEVLSCIRRIDPKYRVEFLENQLVRLYPAARSADPAGLLDVRLQEFFLPPDECVLQQIDNAMDHPLPGFSYTPELSTYLWQKKEAWYRAQDKVVGIVGDFMGDCSPASHRREPIYHNITVREALKLMTVHSLQVARGDVPSTAPGWFKPRAISWKYRFRRDPNADTGLGGIPVFQTF